MKEGLEICMHACMYVCCNAILDLLYLQASRSKATLTCRDPDMYVVTARVGPSLDMKRNDIQGTTTRAPHGSIRLHTHLFPRTAALVYS